MTPAAMSEVVARTLAAADADGDGRISFEDFESSLETFSWFALTVPVTSSSRWERRLEHSNVGGAGAGAGAGAHGGAGATMPHSASGARLSDALLALQLAAAQEEQARALPAGGGGATAAAAAAAAAIAAAAKT